MAICNSEGISDYFDRVNNNYHEVFDELYKPPEVIVHGTKIGSFSSSKPNLQQIPKNICSECKDKGEVPCENCGGTGQTMKMVCYGDMPYEIKEECEECIDGIIECPKCKGDKEMKEKPRMNRTGVRLLVNRIGGVNIVLDTDFKHLVIVVIKNRSIYKSHLIMAIVEKYYFTCDELKSLIDSLDFSKGKGRYCYDKVDDRIYKLISEGILEPWAKGEILKLKKHPSETCASEAVTIKCSNCKGKGHVRCRYYTSKDECQETHCAEEYSSCFKKCPKCKGKGEYRISRPVIDDIVMLDRQQALYDTLESALDNPKSEHDFLYDTFKSEMDDLLIGTLDRKQKRRIRKRYEISNEEFHIKCGKSTRKKYEIRRGELI